MTTPETERTGPEPRVVYFALQDPTYPRNERIRAFLRSELNAHITRVALDARPGFLRHTWQLLRVALSLQCRVDVVVLSEMSIPFALPAWLLARRKHAVFVVDRFVGQYETHVMDRMSVAPRTARAIGYRLADRAAEWFADLLLIDTQVRARLLASAIGGRVPVLSLPVGAPAWAAKAARYRAPIRNRSASKLLYYGNYHPLHDVPSVLTALSLVRGNSDWSLTLIGDGEQRLLAESLAHQLGLSSRTSFKAPMPAPAIGDAIAEHDLVIGVFGGSEKAATVIPNKVWQGLAAGAQVVTRRSDALDEITPFVGDRLVQVEPSDPASLLGALERAINGTAVANPATDLATALEGYVQQQYQALGEYLRQSTTSRRRSNQRVLGRPSLSIADDRLRTNRPLLGLPLLSRRSRVERRKR